MPHYLESDDRELLNKLRLSQVCAECGSRLEGCYDLKKHLPYLQCKANHEHEGIAKEFHPPDERELQIRREIMSEGNVKENQALMARGVPVTGIINYEQADLILQTVWPKAPAIERYKAATICANYGLHPLMKHVFLIAYNEGKPNESWVTVLGIGATRLMMARQGSFSYI